MGFDSVLPAVAVAAFAVAWGVTWLCCRPGSWLYFLDHPNARSLHVRPTPRTGGVGVMAGVAAAALVLIVWGHVGKALLAALGGAFVLAGLGLADDRAGLSARLRLLAQLLVACVLLAMTDGFRESTQSWREVLLDLKRRGLTQDPKLAIGDGALGFWTALREVFPTTQEQRCWLLLPAVGQARLLVALLLLLRLRLSGLHRCCSSCRWLARCIVFRSVERAYRRTGGAGWIAVRAARSLGGLARGGRWSSATSQTAQHRPFRTYAELGV